jgi:hypothetical protein
VFFFKGALKRNFNLGQKTKMKEIFSSKKKKSFECDMRDHQKKNHVRVVCFRRKEERDKKESGAMSSGATTRGQKRRIGQRDVWDLIVNNDDICFKHILPRLNRTDLKFLYGVNTETRKLIKRSSRARDLTKKFKVREMSSILTLEVAWENKSLWPSDWTERSFCLEVAETNKLELLEWIREEKKCKWNGKTINVAVRQGNLEMVKYCVANECPISTWACAYAAANGHLEILKYLREEAEAAWDLRSRIF